MIRDLHNVPYRRHAVEALGIRGVGRPTFANEHVIRWEGSDAAPMREIHLFPGEGGGIRDALVYARSAPKP